MHTSLNLISFHIKNCNCTRVNVAKFSFCIEPGTSVSMTTISCAYENLLSQTCQLVAMLLLLTQEPHSASIDNRFWLSNKHPVKLLYFRKVKWTLRNTLSCKQLFHFLPFWFLIFVFCFATNA